ncbi:hypothetical protein P4672_02940 [Priestia megaterium]|uniref:hypothetical protein n=1 Tax=Priestia megaterium TaxID=1404 RepID=UPI002E232BC8|nr:hypothetical protein [Priestia megaterium]
MIGGQGEDSCGKSGTGETPQKAKSCTEINSGGVTSGSAHVSHLLFVFRLDSFNYVSTSFFFVNRQY